MIVLGHVERGALRDLGRQLLAELLCHCVPDLRRLVALLVGVVEDHAAVLVADVKALPAELRRVVDAKEELYERRVADLLRIKFYANDLGMPGVGRTDLSVRRTLDFAAGVSDRCSCDSVNLTERVLSAPESPAAERRDLKVAPQRRRFIGSEQGHSSG